MSLQRIFMLLALAAAGFGQTQIDLRTQSKDADFSQASSVRPFPTGTTLPSTCSTGSLFFKSDATPGANLFGCVAPNTWAEEAGGGGGGGGGTGTPIGIPLDITRTPTQLSIGAGCGVPTPCRVRIGSVVYSYLSPATATVSEGSGTVYVYVDTSGNITLGEVNGSSPSTSCSGCQVAAGITQFPVDSLPVAIWTASSGVWSSSGTDERTVLSAAPPIRSGTNITVTSTGNSVTIAAGSGGLGLARPGAAAGDSSSSSVRTISPVGASPTPEIDVCTASVRGNFRHVAGAKGQKDSVQVCAKDAADKYAWRTIY